MLTKAAFTCWKYNKNSNILWNCIAVKKLISSLITSKCNLFFWCKAEFSASLLQSKQPLSFIEHKCLCCHVLINSRHLCWIKWSFFLLTPNFWAVVYCTVTLICLTVAIVVVNLKMQLFRDGLLCKLTAKPQLALTVLIKAHGYL